MSDRTRALILSVILGSLYDDLKTDPHLAIAIVPPRRRQPGVDQLERRIVDRDGQVFEYSVQKKGLGRRFAAIGGLFVGMISVGLAELEEYELVVRCRVPSPVAIATSIFMVVCTVLVAVIGHGYTFVATAQPADFQPVMGIAAFAVPGVIIGGQLGPRVGALIDLERMKMAVGALFMVVGALMLVTLAA